MEEFLQLKTSRESSRAIAIGSWPKTSSNMRTTASASCLCISKSNGLRAAKRNEVRFDESAFKRRSFVCSGCNA